MNQKLAEARILAARRMPYMTHQVMMLIPVERPGLGTMAVDEYCRMYFDPAFLEGRDLKHLAFVVLHEAIHVWSRHAKRCVRLLGERPPNDRLGIWRQAVDAAVNDVLEQSGLRCPDEGIAPAKLGLPRNKTAEEYFDLLMQRMAAEQEQQRQQAQQRQQDDADKESQQDGESGEGQDEADQEGQDEGQEGDQPSEEGQGEGGKGQDGSGEEGEDDGEPSAAEIGGSSADGQERPWEDGPPSQEHPGLAEHDQNLVEAAVTKAIEQYQEQRGRGSVPGGLARAAAELLHPKVDPARELLAKVKYAVGRTSGFGDFTYRKPNRRQPHGGACYRPTSSPFPA